MNKDIRYVNLYYNNIDFAGLFIAYNFIKKTEVLAS